MGVLQIELTNSKLPIFPDLKSLAAYLGINYDGSLDIYLGSYAIYWDTMLRDKNRKPDFNDPFDLRHLRYLRVTDNDQILVTSDNGLYNLCQRVASGRVIKTNEFIARFKN